MRILIADDDPICREILRRHLRETGHEVREATNGLMAWEMLQTEHSGLVISDWVMPEIEGPELVRRIRAAGFPRYTYVILLTAQSAPEEIVQGLESGADDYLVKPFQPAELRARIGIGERILGLETRLTEARQAMEQLAMHDGLTDLLNRRAIRERALAVLSRAARARTSTAFIMVDVDHFKLVNDRHGHTVGDQALRLIARCLQRGLRAEDDAGRWGGEEFLIVLENAGLAEAAEVADRIRSRVQSASLPLANGAELKLTISAGVSALQGNEGTPLELLVQEADEALYRAKEAGRDRVWVHGAGSPASPVASV